MDEYQAIKVCLEANLKVIEMCEQSESDKKDIAMLMIATELKKMCESIIPKFEERIVNKN